MNHSKTNYQAIRPHHPLKPTTQVIAKRSPAPLEPSLVLSLLFLFAFALFLVLPVGFMAPLAFALLFIGSFICFATTEEASR